LGGGSGGGSDEEGGGITLFLANCARVVASILGWVFVIKWFVFIRLL